MAAGIFMAVDPRHWKRVAPELRNVLEGPRMNFLPRARGGRAAPRPTPSPEEETGPPPAARARLRGGDNPAPAIVAAPGDHHDRPLFHQVHRGLGNGLAGAEHQGETGSTRGNGKLIGTLHLSCGKDFHCQIPGTSASS